MAFITTDSVFFSATYFYAEDRRLPDVVGSKYVGYPIYHKFRSTSDGRIRVGTEEYWKPYAKYEFREYTVGDEFVSQSAITYTPASLNRPPQRLYKSKFNPLTHKYHGGKLFICTAREEAFPINSSIENPYSYSFIQVWVESNETYENTYDDDGALVRPTYWYHPFHNAFYTLSSIEVNNSFEKDLIELNKFINAVLNGSSADFVDSGVDARSVLSSIRTAQIDREKARGRDTNAAISYVKTSLQKAAATNLQSNATAYNRKVIGSFDASKSTSVRVARQSVGLSTINKPKMVQVIDSSVPANEFEFLHVPNQINYSGIGSEWSQIDRAANKPLVDWRGFKLMQLSFDFLVAPDISGTLDQAQDEKAILKGVDDKLRTLRTMALTPYPITLQGFDAMTSESINFADLSAKGKISFVITDFSVTSIYRSVDGSINRASCQITLQEFPAEAIPKIVFPKLVPIPPRTPGIPFIPPEGCRSLASRTYRPPGQTTSVLVDGKGVARPVVWSECSPEPVLPPANYQISLGLTLS
jgi:hypothetical protein